MVLDAAAGSAKSLEDRLALENCQVVQGRSSQPCGLHHKAKDLTELLPAIVLQDLEVLLFNPGTYGWDFSFVPLLLVSFSTDLDMLQIYSLKIKTGPCRLIAELTCKWIFACAKAESSVLNKSCCLPTVSGVTVIQMDLVKPETTFTD